jgi:hypothetical protein
LDIGDLYRNAGKIGNGVGECYRGYGIDSAKSGWGKNSIKHVRDLGDENVVVDILSHGEPLVDAKHWGRFDAL